MERIISEERPFNHESAHALEACGVSENSALNNEPSFSTSGSMSQIIQAMENAKWLNIDPIREWFHNVLQPRKYRIKIPVEILEVPFPWERSLRKGLVEIDSWTTALMSHYPWGRGLSKDNFSAKMIKNLVSFIGLNPWRLIIVTFLLYLTREIVAETIVHQNRL